MSKRVDFVKSVKVLNESDLRARIQEDELRLKKLTFAHAISPLENPMSIRELRKDISRLKTFLGQAKDNGAAKTGTVKAEVVQTEAVKTEGAKKAPPRKGTVRYSSDYTAKKAAKARAKA
jgi:large subunit ribosomal protein L29